MSKTPVLPDPIRDWCESTVGALSECHFAGWPHQQESSWGSRVWAASSKDRQRYFIKLHRQPRKFHHELHCYQHWAPQVGDTPELVSHDASFGCLILTEVPGVGADTLELDDERQHEMHRQAGIFLRRFHDIEVEDTDHVSLDEALTARLDNWCHLGREHIDGDDIAWAKTRIREGFRHVNRLPTHHDFQPRNWLVDGCQVRFIDFEHTFADHWLLDFVKLATDTWVGRPDLEESFLDGYGRPLTEDDRHELERIGILHGVGSIVWGVRNGSQEYERLGREVLSRLKSEAR